MKSLQQSTVLIIITELNQVRDRDIDLLSGGELQRFAIGIVCVQQADVLVRSLNAIFHEILTGTLATCLMNPHLISMSNRGLAPRA